MKLRSMFDSKTKQSDEIERLRTQVEELNTRYELLTTNLAASVVIFDIEKKVVFCSPYTEVLTGYTLETIAAHTGPGDFFESIVLDTDLERYRRARRVSELGEDMIVRYQIRHQKGFRMWLETRLVPLMAEDGTVDSVMSVSIDVTDTLSYQRQIEEQNRDLSDFAYMVSHDLKAPIFTIKGMAAALREDCGDRLGSDGNELMDYISDAADRLEKLIASVIEYSSISTKSAPETDVDLNQVLHSVLQDFSEQIKQAGAQISVDPQLPTIRGSQVRLYQVFSNLVGNALKYRSKERPAKIQIAKRANTSDSIVIEVRDNGLGIPATKIGDIFRPYQRAHGADIEGSGIGLACVKKIVDRIGGAVSVTSVEGEGSIFTVTLPAQLPKPQAIPQDLVRCFEQ